ncbi:MAG: MBOAT family O-acyltransferase [Bacillota bacterium]
MSFNSFLFILAFLPVVLIVYQLLIRRNRITESKLWLVAVSLFFYGYAGLSALAVLVVSMLVNYLVPRRFFPPGKTRTEAEKRWLIIGIGANIGLLAYLKYFDFALSVLGGLVHLSFHPPQPFMMLGISFITFQQIAFLIDAYRGQVESYNLIDYFVYITFFPKIVSGPITRYGYLVPQLQESKALNAENLAKGLYVFCIGLFKKVVIADTLAKLAAAGFDTNTQLSMIEGWITSLSYTGQIYFDFSGYTDMAIGVALMLNIKLPFNFNSPYRAVSIRDFWGRWHITLTRFLTDYLYIPLGGSREGELKTLRNIMITFLISGVWHGASWTFVFWGFLHGLAMVVQRLWQKLGIKLPRLLAWFITFNFVNVAWVFFRAADFTDALRVLHGMFYPAAWGGFNVFTSIGAANLYLTIPVAIIAVVMLLLKQNSNSFTLDISPMNRKVYLLAILVIVSVLFLNSSVPKEFIYNDF